MSEEHKRNLESYLQFQSLLAEGDTLIIKSQYQEALDILTRALDLISIAADEDDKNGTEQMGSASFGRTNCLISRAKARLGMGDGTGALKDAEDALSRTMDPHALLAKAESLYLLGDFEHALIQFHRGCALKSEWPQFRHGVAKCTDAIKQAVQAMDPKLLRQARGFQKAFDVQPTGNNKKLHQQVSVKAALPRPNDPTKYRVVLEELAEDHAFLESLYSDPSFASESYADMREVVKNSLDYLEKRIEFWRQRHPFLG